MNKKMICAAAVLLALSGCSKKTPVSSVPSGSASDSVSISAAGFTENQAETLMSSIVANHCAQAGVACEVTAVSISGNDVIANYTFEKNGEAAEGSVVLKNVTVDANNANLVSFDEKKFTEGAAEIKKPAKGEEQQEEAKADDSEEKEDDKKGDKEKDKDKIALNIPKFDIPAGAPDLNEPGATDDVTVVSEPGIRLKRIYVTRENFVCDGVYEGQGTFRVILLDMNQKVEGVAVEKTGYGEFSGVTPISEGFHYMLLMTDDGGWTISWAALPDDMVPHN